VVGFGYGHFTVAYSPLRAEAHCQRKFCYTIPRNPEQWEVNLSLENELCEIMEIINPEGAELACRRP
jgi:hypothetical protein